MLTLLWAVVRAHLEEGDIVTNLELRVELGAELDDGTEAIAAYAVARSREELGRLPVGRVERDSADLDEDFIVLGLGDLDLLNADLGVGLAAERAHLGGDGHG